MFALFAMGTIATLCIEIFAFIFVLIDNFPGLSFKRREFCRFSALLRFYTLIPNSQQSTKWRHDFKMMLPLPLRVADLECQNNEGRGSLSKAS